MVTSALNQLYGVQQITYHLHMPLYMITPHYII